MHCLFRISHDGRRSRTKHEAVVNKQSIYNSQCICWFLHKEEITLLLIILHPLSSFYVLFLEVKIFIKYYAMRRKGNRENCQSY